MKSDELVGNSKYYDALAARAKRQYNDEYAAGYRESDDRGISAPTHTDLGDLITEVSTSFGRPIAVLDLGCGTGRYFHCLRNVKSLVGVDVSPNMVRLARHPVNAADISFPITLLCSNIASASFADESFDLIYAMGVFGHFLPLDACIAKNVARMLRGGGVFVFTTVDGESPHATSWKRRAAEAFLPVLPSQIKLLVKARLCSFRILESELVSLIERENFYINSIKRRQFAGLVEIVCAAGRS